MKRQILLFTAVAGFAFLTLSSYSSGPNNPPNSLGDRTPNGSNATCGAIGCHGANDPNTAITLTLIGSTGNVIPGGKYKPGTVYTVSLGATNAAAVKFGFQITAKKASGQAGSFLAGSNTRIFSGGGLTGIEHSSPIVASGTGATTMPSFTWTAPTGTGDVTFGAIINAVNGNANADAGDHASTATLLFHEYNPASVAELSEKIRITAYPNPALNNVNLKFEDADKGNYNITAMDMRGVKVYATNATVGNTGNVSIEAGNWASGMYFLQIEKDGARRVIPVTKQ